MKPALTSSPPLGHPAREFPAEVEVCRQFAPRLRAIALRHLRDRTASEDVVQDVLVSVVLALRERRIDAPESLPAYVLSACRRRIADMHRTDARRSALSEELHVVDFLKPAEPRPPSKHLDIEMLVTALMPLSGRERQILSETYAAERSAEEIARDIGTTATHVRVLRHRALAKMRAALEWEDA